VDVQEAFIIFHTTLYQASTPFSIPFLPERNIQPSVITALQFVLQIKPVFDHFLQQHPVRYNISICRHKNRAGAILRHDQKFICFGSTPTIDIEP
jgi:hypothetical protein